MDPFSVIVGVGSLIEMSVSLAKYLKDVYEAAILFEEEIGWLLRDIQDLNSVNKSIENLYRLEICDSDPGQLPRQDVEVWQNTVKTLQECSKTVKRLQKVLEAITGRGGAKVTGWRDGIKKQLRKQSKDSELDKIRAKLSVHRDSLNVSLTLLNLIYTRRGSKEAQKFGFQLHRQIAALQSRLPTSEANFFDDSLNAATAVASTLRLNQHFYTPRTVSSIYTGRQGYLDGLKKALDSSHSSSRDFYRTLPGTTLYSSPSIGYSPSTSIVYSPSGDDEQSSPLKSPHDPPVPWQNKYSSPTSPLTHKRFVIFGLGGSGKTQFCCKFASDNKQRFWGVFTVDASSPGSAQQSFITIAKACGTDPNDRAAKSFLSSSDRPWLLIIDNADDTNLEIDRYFPDGEHGLTLITTRNPSVKMHGTIGQRFYHFDRLNDDEANELLLRAADNFEPRTPTVRELASAITRKLGSLPLALIHAGNAIKAKYCELSNYISYYERSWQIIRQSQRATRKHEDEDEDDSEYMKVYASYEIVFRGLEAVNLRRYRDAVQILKLFSFFHHENIPFEVLTAAVKNPRIQREADAQAAEQVEQHNTGFLTRESLSRAMKKNIVEPILRKQLENQNPVVLPTFLRDAELSGSADDGTVRLHKALYLLTQLSLVTYYENSDSYSMHPLIHIWVRERPQMTARAQAVWCEAALHTLSRCILLPPLSGLVDPQGDLARKLLPHFISVRKLQQKINEEFLANQEKRLRPWPALESRLSPWRSMFLVKSAIAYSECGYFAETEDCLRIVLDFYRKFLGPTHPRTELVALTVADCLWQQCRINDAADIQEQVLQSNLKVLGPDHPRTLRVMDRLGESRRRQGRLSESIELLTKAVNGLKLQLPETDPAIYHSLEQLGTVLRVCFRFEDARRYQEQALAGMKRCLGEKDNSTLLVTEELARTYKELGTLYLASKRALAQHYLETARMHASFLVEQRISQVGEKHPRTWMAQGVLYRIKAATGGIEEAEQMFSLVLPIAARHLGPNHPGVLRNKSEHSKILIQQKRYREAEDCLLDISRPTRDKTETFTGDHPDQWDAVWTLVDCYQKQGKIERSLATCNELLDAVGEIRQGKEQTEMSSTLWEMMLAKRAELMEIMNSDIAEGSLSHTPASLSQSSETVVFQQGMQARSSDPQVAATQVGPRLRLRETW